MFAKYILRLLFLIAAVAGMGIGPLWSGEPPGMSMGQEVFAAPGLQGADESWIVALGLLLVGPILSFVAALVALVTVWQFLRGNKAAALYGIGMFIFLAVVLSLAQLIARQPQPDEAGWFTVMAPVFGHGRDEFRAFSFFSGTLLGYFEIGALVLTRVMTSIAFTAFFVTAFILGGMVLAFQTSVGGDNAVGGIVRYIIVAIFVVGLCLFPVVRYQLDPTAIPSGTGEVSSVNVLNLQASRGTVHSLWGFTGAEPEEGDTEPKPVLSRIPLYPALILSAANGISEELARAFYGRSNLQRELDNASASQNTASSLKSASIPRAGALHTAFLGNYCNSALAGVMSFDMSSEEGATEVIDGQTRVGNLIQWVNQTKGRWEGASQLGSHAFYVNPLSPAALDLYYYIDASAWIRRPLDSDAQLFASFLEEYIRLRKQESQGPEDNIDDLLPSSGPDLWRYRPRYAQQGQPFLSNNMAILEASVTARGKHTKPQVSLGYSGAINHPASQTASNRNMRSWHNAWGRTLPGIYDAPMTSKSRMSGQIRLMCFLPFTQAGARLTRAGYDIDVWGRGDATTAHMESRNPAADGRFPVAVGFDGTGSNHTGRQNTLRVRGGWGHYSTTSPDPLPENGDLATPPVNESPHESGIQVGNTSRVWTLPDDVFQHRATMAPGLHMQIAAGRVDNHTIYMHDLSLVATGAVTQGFNYERCREAVLAGVSHPLFWGCFNRSIGATATTFQRGSFFHYLGNIGVLASGDGIRRVRYGSVSGSSIVGSSQDGPLYNPEDFAVIYSDMARMTQWSQSFEPLSNRDIPDLTVREDILPEAISNLDVAFIHQSNVEDLTAGGDAPAQRFSASFPEASRMFRIFGSMSMTDGASMGSATYGSNERLLGPIGAYSGDNAWTGGGRHSLDPTLARFSAARLFAWTISSTPTAFEFIDRMSGEFIEYSRENAHIVTDGGGKKRGFFASLWGFVQSLLSIIPTLLVGALMLLLDLLVLLLKALFGHALGAIFMVLIIFFFLVPPFAVYPGQWGILLSWARTVMWVALWPAFFIVGHVIAGQASVPFGTPSDFASGTENVFGKYLQAIVLQVLGMSFMLSAPATAALILTASSNGFSQIASMTYGTFMKAVGGAVAVAGLAAGPLALGALKGGGAALKGVGGAMSAARSAAKEGGGGALKAAGAAAKAGVGAVGKNVGSGANALKNAAVNAPSALKAAPGAIGSAIQGGALSGLGKRVGEVASKGAGMAADLDHTGAIGGGNQFAGNAAGTIRQAKGTAGEYANRIGAGYAASRAGALSSSGSSSSPGATGSMAAAQSSFDKGMQSLRAGDQTAAANHLKDAVAHSDAGIAKAKSQPAGLERSAAIAGAATAKAQSAHQLAQIDQSPENMKAAEDSRSAAIAATQQAFQESSSAHQPLSAGIAQGQLGRLAAMGGNTQTAASHFSIADQQFAKVGTPQANAHRVANAAAARELAPSPQFDAMMADAVAASNDPIASGIHGLVTQGVSSASFQSLGAEGQAPGPKAVHSKVIEMADAGTLPANGPVASAQVYQAINAAQPGYLPSALGSINPNDFTASPPITPVKASKSDPTGMTKSRNEAEGPSPDDNK